MVTIYKADVDEYRQEKSLNDLLDEFPSSMKNRALRYRFEQDAYNFVIGRLLLKKGLEILGMGEKFTQIKYEERGKPTLDGVFFSISHSENFVVCAISTESVVGIDVEVAKEKPLVLEHFRSFFRDREWKDIQESAGIWPKFYQYWTRKESIIKALGVDLSYLHQIELDVGVDCIVVDGATWYLRDLDFGGGRYGAVCCSGEMEILIVLDLGDRCG